MLSPNPFQSAVACSFCSPNTSLSAPLSITLSLCSYRKVAHQISHFTSLTSRRHVHDHVVTKVERLGSILRPLYDFGPCCSLRGRCYITPLLPRPCPMQTQTQNMEDQHLKDPSGQYLGVCLVQQTLHVDRTPCCYAGLAWHATSHNATLLFVRDLWLSQRSY
jgi:hypothetical protein